MRISTKGRYALRLMLDIAMNDAEGKPVRVKDIAKRQEVSGKYLEQIVSVLNKSDLLQTNRGFQGGYRLAVPPEKCTVGMILRLTEGNLAPVACLEHSPHSCERSAVCPTLFVWEGLGKVINEYLDGITLRDILDKKKENYSNDYVI